MTDADEQTRADAQPSPPARRDATEELPYVDDRVSRLWVLLIVAVFAAIFLWGVLGGRNGILIAGPSPSPGESLEPTPSQLISPSPASSPTTSPAASPTASPTVMPSPT
jgi:hypothetical protein